MGQARMSIRCVVAERLHRGHFRETTCIGLKLLTIFIKPYRRCWVPVVVWVALMLSKIPGRLAVCAANLL